MKTDNFLPKQEMQRYIHIYGVQMEQRYRPSTIRVYLRFLNDFNSFQNEWRHRKQSWQGIQDENLILAWIQDQSLHLQVNVVGVAIRVLRDFMEFLKSQGLIKVNIVDVFYKQYPRRGWKGLARVGESQETSLALEKLRPEPRFSGPWGHHMREFLDIKRKLGTRYETEEKMLLDLDRYLSHAGVMPEGKIPPVLIHKWLEGKINNNSRTRRTKRSVAEHFFEYAIGLGLLGGNPAKINTRREPRRTMRPFIFTTEQVKDILERATKLPDVTCFPYRGTTYAMIFSTLFSLGLRISEACHLCLNDIDLDKGLLLVRETKFFKSRLLPLGPKYLKKLANFISLRQTLRDGEQKDAPLFTARYGRTMNRNTVGGVF